MKNGKWHRGMIQKLMWELIFMNRQGYMVNVKGTEKCLILSRGILKEIVNADGKSGASILENLLPSHLPIKVFFKGIDLMHD